MKIGKQNKTVSIADIVQLIAFFAFVVLTYIGLLMDYSPSTSFVYVLVYLILFIIVIFALIKVKKVENNFVKFRIVESILVVVFVTLTFLLSDPMIKALSINSERNTLIDQGKSDIGKIENMFELYEQTERDIIDKIEQSFCETVGSNFDSYTRKLVDSTKRHMTIDSYCDVLLTNKYLGDGGEGDLNYEEFKAEKLEKLNEAKTDLDHWNLLKIPELATDIDSINVQVARQLTRISGQRHPDHIDLPYKYVFKHINYSTYSIDRIKTSELEVNYVLRKPVMHFRKDIEKARSSSAIFISVFIFILMLFGYFVANRSSTVEIKKNKNSDFDNEGIDIVNSNK